MQRLLSSEQEYDLRRHLSASVGYTANLSKQHKLAAEFRCNLNAETSILSFPTTSRLRFFAVRSSMKTAPEAYHLCAERGASLCKAPSWVLVLQSTVSPPTLESAPLTRDCLAFLFRYALRPCAPSASSGHRDPTSRHSSLRFRVW